MPFPNCTRSFFCRLANNQFPSATAVIRSDLFCSAILAKNPARLNISFTISLFFCLGVIARDVRLELKVDVDGRLKVSLLVQSF